MTDINNSSDSFNLVQFLGILFKNFRFLIIQIIVTSILSLALVFIIPLTFTSSAVIVNPGQFNVLGNILPMGMTKGLSGIIGSSLGQGGETSTLIAILNSRKLSEDAIRKFDLMERFSSPTIEDALVSFGNKKSIELTEEGTIVFSISFDSDFFPTKSDKEKTANLAYDVASYMVNELDNIYTGLGTQKARYEREVIEKRYLQNQQDLFEAEEALKEFSQKSGIIEIETQAEEAISAIASLESRINIERIKLNISEKLLTPNNPEVTEQKYLVSELEKQLNNYLLKTDSTELVSAFPALSEAPELGMIYFRLMREVEVQSILFEFLTQQYEQLKIQEAKDTPSIQYIDSPQVPTKKSAPKRSIVIIAIVLSCTILSIIYVLIKELYFKRLSLIFHEIKSISSD